MWRHPISLRAEYNLSDRNTVWRGMRASRGGSTGYHCNIAKLLGVILPRKKKAKFRLTVKPFSEKLKRKSPGLRSKTIPV